MSRHPYDQPLGPTWRLNVANMALIETPASITKAFNFTVKKIIIAFNVSA